MHWWLLHAVAQLVLPPRRMVQRDYDVVTRENETLIKLFTIPSMPTYMGVAPSGKSSDEDVFADMTWYRSERTGMVQMHPLVPLKNVYLQQHNAVIGGIWSRHHDSFASLIAKYGPKHVLEIGGGHGYLAMKLLFTGAVQEWTMVDPNPLSIFPLPSLTIVKKYIEEIDVLPESVDAIVHSHTLEHIYDPSLFFKRLRTILKVGSLHIFSIPNLFELAKQDAPCLHFEHTLLLQERWVDALLQLHGFKVVEKAPFGGSHSIFYVTSLVDKSDRPLWPNADLGHMMHHSERVALVWHRHLVVDAIAATAQLSENRSLNFLYAAHVGSQYLLSLGLPEERLTCILDNNPDKEGARLYGTNLWVKRPSVIQGLPSPRVVLRQGAYNQEIEVQLLAINPSTVIIKQVPLRRPEMATSAASGHDAAQPPAMETGPVPVKQVAVCIAGVARSFHHTAYSTYSQIIKPIRPVTDVFFAMDLRKTAGTLERYINKDLAKHPQRLRTSGTPSLLYNETFANSGRWTEAEARMWAAPFGALLNEHSFADSANETVTLGSCRAQVLAHERQRGFPYQWVMRVRPDVMHAFTMPPYERWPRWLGEAGTAQLFTFDGIEGRNRGICNKGGIWALMTRSAADVYFRPWPTAAWPGFKGFNTVGCNVSRFAPKDECRLGCAMHLNKVPFVLCSRNINLGEIMRPASPRAITLLETDDADRLSMHDAAAATAPEFEFRCAEVCKHSQHPVERNVTFSNVTVSVQPWGETSVTGEHKQPRCGN